MNFAPQLDDRSVETTSSDKSSNDHNETDAVVVLAIVELDGLFDDGARNRLCTTSARDESNNDTFITKIRIYQSELTLVVPSTELSDNTGGVTSKDHQRTSYVYTAQQLRDKITCHFAGRLMIPPVSTQKEATTVKRRLDGATDEGCYHIYIYNNATNEYLPLPEDDDTNVIPLFGTRWRVRVVYKANENLDAASEKAPVPLLAIQGRYFADDIQPDGTVMVDKYSLRVLPPNPASSVDAHVCTGYHVWDGAILLIRYLQLMRQFIFNNENQQILELGSGCGVVGMAAALLGAKHVTLTDLPELLPFLQSTVDANLKTIESAREQLKLSSDYTITCESCDWTEPLPRTIQGKVYDIILVADCIWIESLVTPLFDTLKKLTDNDTKLQRERPTLVIDDSNRVLSKVPETILEHEAVTSSDDIHLLLDLMANCSISHMDLGKSKTSLDESPVNSDADIYHQQSSQQLSGIVNFHDNNISINNGMDQSMPSLQIDIDSKEMQSESSVSIRVDAQPTKESGGNEPTTQESAGNHQGPNATQNGHGTTVLIAYQRRGKSTHETFISELYKLFTAVEIVSVPHFDYPHDIFYLYSCRR